MSKRKYEQVQILLPEIRAMVAAGKTQREIAEHFGLTDKFVVKRLLKRERDKDARLCSGIVPRSKGRPRKDGQAPKRDIQKELEQLRMENKLLRDFLQSMERM